MKLALLRTVGNSVRHPASYPSTRALHTAPVVMRQTRVQAMGGESDKRDSSNLPARPSAPESGLSLFGPRSFLSPFSALRQMEQEMDSLMRGFGLPALETALAPQGAMSLAVDVQDKGDHYEIAADVPGLSREDIKVEISPNNVLTISGERKSETKSEEGGVVRMERSYGTFMRSFRLPEHVDPEGIKAHAAQGVLKLTVPKSPEKEEKRTIPVNVEGE